jgi:hypothetical protein
MRTATFVQKVRTSIKTFRQYWKQMDLAIWALKAQVASFADSGPLAAIQAEAVNGTDEFGSVLEGNDDLQLGDFLAAAVLAKKVGDLLDTPMATLLADQPAQVQAAFAQSNFANSTALGFVSALAKAD